MAVTSGFYNSLGGDRKYSAEQFSALFDGVVTDGIYAHVGRKLTVEADGTNKIQVGTGRAWFNHTWTLNDATLTLALEDSDILFDRYDTVFLEVDTTEAGRANNIKVIRGAASSTPKPIPPVRSGGVYQYRLADILRKAGSTTTAPGDVTNYVGTSDAPFVTGILQQVNIDDLLRQWGSQWNAWFQVKIQKADSDINVWMSQRRSEFDTWFREIKVIVDTNVAATLANRLLSLEHTWDVFASEGSLYRSIDDASGGQIKDSAGNDITGRLVYMQK